METTVQASQETNTQSGAMSALSKSNPSLASSPPPRIRLVYMLLKRIDSLLSRLSALLSTPAGTDSLLRTISYTIQFLYSSMHDMVAKQYKTIGRVTTLPLVPGKSLATALAYMAPTVVQATVRGRALNSLISDFRIFSRLWGLLDMYSWGRSLARNPPQDPILRCCTYGQLTAYTAYQFLENRAYLAGKHLIARPDNRISADWLWSSRCWLVAILLEYFRLARVWQKRRALDEPAVHDKQAAVDQKIQLVQWRSDLLINIINSPLVVHWSADGGTLGDSAVGFLGMVAGLVSLRQRWSDTKIMDTCKIS